VNCDAHDTGASQALNHGSQALNNGKHSTRLDVALVERGLLSTRARAQGAILAGEVFVDGARVTKTGARVDSDAVVELRPQRPPFVGRGGYKLDHALTAFAVDVRGLRAVDVGASTGGFTDCLLQRGAARVYAVDVGSGQLDWHLRNDPRVTALERRDVRSVRPDDLGGPVDVATVDVSFIGLGKVLPALRALVRPGAAVLALVKPQFEAGPKAAKRGVVRDPAVHEEVLRRVIAQAETAGFRVLDATYSPIAGPDGNLEYFLRLEAAPGASQTVDVAAVIRSAHATVPRRGVPVAAGRAQP
jgi:23S rRNA (cytidine1920-2'-O)/16S rRNA (cytidine1409-2'-O)-methyltransferase